MPASSFLFGKLPAHGDFVMRGLGEAAQQAWDDWATKELDTARAGLGDRFDAAHDISEPIRFVCGPGALGEGWQAGAVAPSIDASGRRFLILMGVGGLQEAEGITLGVAVAERCEGAIRRALVDTLEADAALEAIGEAGPCGGEAAAAALVEARMEAGGVWWRRGDANIATGVEPPPGFLEQGLMIAADSERTSS